LRYDTAAAFRQALEDRLRALSRETGLPLMRLRKLVAFERLVVRLEADQPGRWVLKGGLALQWRLGGLARTTKDVDLALRVRLADPHEALMHAGQADLADWFSFFVHRPASLQTPLAGALRFPVVCLLDGRRFETFHIDVGWGDPITEAPERLPVPSLLQFAGLTSCGVLCYPISQHLAEKVHAYSRPHPTGSNTRAKDLVDILLLGKVGTLSAEQLARAIEATFARRGTHRMPASLPEAPAAWAAAYRRMAAEVDLPAADLAAAMSLAHSFLDPVLSAQARGVWDPVTWRWQG